MENEYFMDDFKKENNLKSNQILNLKNSCN